MRGHGVIGQTTKFHHIKTVGYYNDVINRVMPVPFVYSNGELDIRLEDDVENQLINNETAGTRYIRGLAKSMGGTGLVQSIGPNFVRWLNNWLSDYYDSSVIDTYSIEVRATVTKV